MAAFTIEFQLSIHNILFGRGERNEPEFPVSRQTAQIDHWLAGLVSSATDS